MFDNVIYPSMNFSSNHFLRSLLTKHQRLLSSFLPYLPNIGGKEVIAGEL
jgi:hypothetical protein